MTLPGFDAQSSLYRTSSRYPLAAVTEYSTGVTASTIELRGYVQGCALLLPAPNVGPCKPHCGPCQPNAEQGPGLWRCCVNSECDELCRRCALSRVCGPCENCDAVSGWWQNCCVSGTNDCVKKACIPREVCSIQDNRTCWPWPFNHHCSGKCTKTCCEWSGCDQRRCAISEC